MAAVVHGHDMEARGGEGLSHPLIAEGMFAEAVGQDHDAPLRSIGRPVVPDERRAIGSVNEERGRSH